MPPKAARRREGQQNAERFYKVIRYSGNEYSESEPMPETLARRVAELEERQDKRWHISIVPARGR